MSQNYVTHRIVPMSKFCKDFSVTSIGIYTYNKIAVILKASSNSKQLKALIEFEPTPYYSLIVIHQ